MAKRAWQEMTIWDWIYDVIGLFIALSDVITDYIVTYQYYQDGHMIYFWIACGIFAVAQTTYAGMFIMTVPRTDSICLRFIIFLFYFPFAATLSMFWWLQAVGLFQDTLSMFGCKSDEEKKAAHNAKKDVKSEWIDYKFRNHAGFLVESMIESFPMSIIQMIAIVDLQEPHLINIISILLSMISVGTKSIFFSYSMDNYVFVFHWVCVFVDCFGIFTSIAWGFYFYDLDQVYHYNSYVKSQQ